jgi:methyl-accepting chemotaxis protein
MKILNGMKLSARLSLMSGTAIAGIVCFAVVAFVTLLAIRINSPMYDNIAPGYQLGGDCYDPPASLVAALPPTIAAEDATTPEDTRKAIDLLRQDHQAFTSSQKHYHDALPDGAMRTLMQNESAPLGEEWFAIAEREYIPALLAGDHDGARRIRILKMDPLFTRHKAANDKLSELTADWIPSLEAKAAGIIRTRSIELGILVAGMVVLLLVLSVSIIRSIVSPMKKAIDVLVAMAQGNLSISLDLDSRDEMGEVADALNRTIASFRTVLAGIAQAAEKAAAASAELSATTQGTRERTREHSLETQQVAAAMVEMSAAIGEVSDAAKAAAESGLATESAADQGHVVVEETMAAIKQAAEITTQTANQIRTLGENSEQIGRIVGVIDEIANQTNLLALNAAIEAARAGEQGRGFAVVAGEVRRLAERTSQATREIGAMISSIQQETTSAVHSMEDGRRCVAAGLAKTEQCGSALDQIVKLAREAGGRAQQIASSASEQTAVANQVTESINGISSFTAHSTAAGEQTVAACSELARMAADLEQHAQRFNLGQIA